MDPQDHLPAFPDGLACTVCRERVPRERIRLLACRDDLVFVQSDCARCGSTSLGFVLGGEHRGPDALPDESAPVSSDDVLEMHRFLEGWDGDLASLLRSGSGR